MNTSNPELSRRPISRRHMIGLLAATAAGSAASLNNPSLAEACMAPAIIIKDDSSKVATVNVIGQRIIEEILGSQLMNRSVEGPSTGVDLRLSLAQDPENTARFATFKSDRDILVPNWATLIGGELYDKPGGIKGLNLYGKDIQWKGNWNLDTVGKVERCGIEELEEAWLVNVDRAIRDGSQINFTHEFSFPVVPNCGPKLQRYLSIVRRSLAQPTPTTEATPIIEHPTQMPIRGEAGESPAQMPLK